MKAIILDAFGTIMDIGKPTHPYKRAGADRKVMMGNVPLAELTSDPDILLSLEEELKSIFIYAEVWRFIELCREREIKVAIGSNLAMPYAAVVRETFGAHVDHLHLSCEVGLIKPDPKFFLTACEALDTLPEDTMMIGDSLASDFDGATNAGLNAMLLRRNEGASLLECFVW